MTTTTDITVTVTLTLSQEEAQWLQAYMQNPARFDTNYSPDAEPADTRELRRELFNSLKNALTSEE